MWSSQNNGPCCYKSDPLLWILAVTALVLSLAALLTIFIINPIPGPTPTPTPVPTPTLTPTPTPEPTPTPTPTPEPTPAGLEGIQAELTGAEGGLFPDGENIIFNTVVNDTTESISYDPATGVFTISEPGTYKVDWWVSSDGAGPAVTVNYTLEMNDAPYTTVSSPIVSGQTSGSALVTVDSAPATIALVNSTGDDIFIPSFTPVQAGIVITK